MSRNTLFDKVWEKHKVCSLASGEDQLLIGLHLIHEVTSPQAFQMIREMGLKVKYPSRTFATVDHIVPTKIVERPFEDDMAEKMLQELEKNTKEFGIEFFNLASGKQGIVHVIGPELGLTQPGMTIACGDSHTSTHGAFGSIGFGIGTSQIRDVFASQCIALKKPKLRKIQIDGELPKGVYAKDIILRIIADLGVKGGLGYAYEYAGSTIMSLSMEERMTICNMSIEGGARVGYVNPDQTTFDYIKGRPYAPQGDAFDKACAYWKSISSDTDTSSDTHASSDTDTSSDTKAEYDDVYRIDAKTLKPMLTWGITPGQAVAVDSPIPSPEQHKEKSEQELAKKALAHMQFQSGECLIGKQIDVAFIGSCTNGRLSDLQEAAKIVEGKKVAPHVFAFVVPGSLQVSKAAVQLGLDRIFRDAGFEWRGAGCSICLGMNNDKLKGGELCASTSNRNFIGRQGSPKGRTLLMSPAMVAHAAISGSIQNIQA